MAFAAALGAGASSAAAQEAAPPEVVSEPAAESVVAPAPPQVAYVETQLDVLPPSLAIGKVQHRLEYARRHGLQLGYTVAEPVSLRADVLLYGDVSDRELRMSALPGAGPGISLGSATVARTAVGAGTVRLAFNPAARRTIRKFLKLTVLVRVIATDDAGNEKTAYKRVSLSNL